MTPARLNLDSHQLMRLKQRQIARKKVRQCIAKGLKVSHDKKSGRIVKQMQFGSRLLEVVYVLKKGGYALVTAYWKGEADK